MALVDVVKFDSPSDDIFAYKFPGEDLSLGAQLIVNQGQEALFVKGGEPLDIFTAGTHTLSTKNIPLLNKLINLPFGGKTPFSAEIWYVSKIAKRNLAWGTKSPIPLVDPKYNYPVSVRAFGQYGIRIKDSRSFLAQIVGPLKVAESEKVEEYFIGEIIQKLSSRIADFFVNEKVSIFEVNSKLNLLSEYMLHEVQPEFEKYGIQLENFNVDRISIPAEERQKFQEVLGKRMEIEQISQSQVGSAYSTMRTFDTLDKVAENESGSNLFASGLGLGVGLGAGIPVGQNLGSKMNVGDNGIPGDSDIDAKLRRLKKLLDDGIISPEDFDKKKNKLLEDL